MTVGTTSTPAAANLLATLVAATRRGVEVRAASRPTALVEREIVREPGGDDFITALARSPSPRIIAECKRRSPSRGILRLDYEAGTLASEYAAAGAAAISVLTEPTFFDGSPEDLRAVRAAVSIPVLRKDFIVSDYQLIEAAALGADAALLIVAALDEASLKGLIRRCVALRLAALVEVHDEVELERALNADARVIGVNSRNLQTLDVDPGVLERLAPRIPDGIVAVAESGLKTQGDILRLAKARYDAFLVGERLVTAPQPGEALRQLRGVTCG